MKKILCLALLLLAPLAQAETAGTVIRFKHSTSNISTTAYTRILGSLVKRVTKIHISNSSTSGTLVLAIGCTGGRQTNVLIVQPGVNEVFPQGLAAGDCLFAAAADATISLGDATYAAYVE